MKKSIESLLFDSWIRVSSPKTSMDEIYSWIENLNQETRVNIKEITFKDGDFWFYDQKNGEIVNAKKSFFSVRGLQYFVDDDLIAEQPIIFQNEIGFLGILVKEFEGVLYFLMQAKIEPGNVNGVQISPSIQATRSNFRQVHGGSMPLYFEYFKDPQKYGTVLYDQIQSEQGNRFLGKRNRNIIIYTDENIEMHPNYKWMTLGQIKELMKINNLVNMDARTVISGLLTVCNGKNGENLEHYFNDKALYSSLFSKKNGEEVAFTLLNNYKQYKDVSKVFIPLAQLKNWIVDERGVTCTKKADFDVRYYRIEIEGREVQSWTQPLFKARSKALFVLFTCIDDGVLKFLISLNPEIGCFDKIEYAPSIQIANYDDYTSDNDLHNVFKKHEQNKEGIMADVLLSEEGGRFYHEQNRNVIVQIEKDELKMLDKHYIWVDYAMLNRLLLNNNYLNIQLRNLMSLLTI